MIPHGRAAMSTTSVRRMEVIIFSTRIFPGTGARIPIPSIGAAVGAFGPGITRIIQAGFPGTGAAAAGW